MSNEEYAYLRDGFNARSLKKDQLRNILLTHDVAYSDDMLKPQLLELFMSEIVPRRAELRSRYIDVAASGENIETATPPAKDRKSRVDAVETNDSNVSPRAKRARSRSPTRAISPARKPKEVKELEIKPDLQVDEAPKLSPPSPLAEPPKSPASPKSPRRRRANRKVEIAEPVPEKIEVPAEDIKVKVPRSPRRKRVHEDLEADSSFSTENVFQKTAPKKRKSNAPKTEDQKEQQQQQQEKQQQQHTPQFYPEADTTSSRVSQHAPVTEADISIDALPLDADFVADLNAEVDRLERSQADSVNGFDPVALFNQESQRYDQLHQNTSSHSQQPQDQSNELPDGLDQQDNETSPRTDTSVQPQAPAGGDISSVGQSEISSVDSSTANTPVRRGFIPSLADLSVSRAFAEQMEPFLAPSPIPTPRNSVPPQRSRGQWFQPEKIVVHKPSTDAKKEKKASKDKNVGPEADNKDESRESSIELSDAEGKAAEGLHKLVDNAVEVSKAHKWFNFSFNLQLPNIRGAASRLVPRVSTDTLKTIGAILFTIASAILCTCLISLGIAFGKWYWDATAAAEFCGVGSAAPRIYPQWTLYDTGYSPVSDLQGTFRSMMDEVWPACIQCPANAHCYQNRIVLCNNGFRQSAHPLAVAGIWPKPPRCLPDWEAQRKLDVLSERAALYLREKRAEVLCDHPEIADSEIELASAMHTRDIESLLHKEKSPLLSDEEFEVLWQQVAEQLPSQHADVYVVSLPPDSRLEYMSGREQGNNNEILSEGGQLLTETQNDAIHHGAKGSDSATQTENEGEVDPTDLWLASNSDARLSLSCRFRRHVTRWVIAHRYQISVTILSLAFASGTMLIALHRIGKRRRQRNAVEAFVERLKVQRAFADADPTGATVPYLRSTDLRNDVPLTQFRAVQAALEKVDGVRMRQIEIHGEISRVWEWVL